MSKLRKFWMLMEESLEWDTRGIWGHYYYESLDEAERGAERMSDSLVKRGLRPNVYVLECISVCSAKETPTAFDWVRLAGTSK